MNGTPDAYPGQLAYFSSLNSFSALSQHLPSCASFFISAEASCNNVSWSCASFLVPSRPPGAPGWPGISRSQSIASTFLMKSSVSSGYMSIMPRPGTAPTGGETLTSAELLTWGRLAGRCRGGALILMAEHQTALFQIIGRHFDRDPVASQCFDTVLLHLSGGVGDDRVSGIELNPIARIG